MFFGYFTLAVAFSLSVVAAYYSVLGLVAIFSSAAIPVIIMGGALETGKVIAAMWLHRNWHRAPWTYKAYLLPSLLALMLLTSMGTFGYLSKAHSDQSLVSGDVLAKISLFDERIRISRENIDANRAALRQLDAGVDQTLARSTSEQGAERSVQIRRQQGPERQRLLREIETEQKKIAELNEERAPISAEVRKVEAEVGPIKYIAALIYGDTTDTNLLESAVRWVIILIVVVFDPLAIVLILAGTRHLEWERESRRPSAIVITPSTTSTTTIPATTSTTTTTTTSSTTSTTTLSLNRHSYLDKSWNDRVPGVRMPIQVFRENNLNLIERINEVKDILPPTKNIPPYTIISDELVNIDGRTVHKENLPLMGLPDVLDEIQQRQQGIYQEVKLLPQTEVNVTFGKEFPNRPEREQMHVDISALPTKLYKFELGQWVEVDKTLNSSYTNNDNYIRYLIGVLQTGELLPDKLTENELSMIEEYIKNVKSNNNPTG